VLIVTGSERTRRMYGEYLAWRGVNVREVNQAATAVRELSRLLPDAVVIEDRLPDSTGTELVRALRRSRHTFNLPVILLCSDIFAIDAAQAERYGCDRILVVPLLPEALYDELQQVVDRRSEGARPFESWLFTRNGESVWMVRTTELELSVAGPGRQRDVFDFENERDLVAFQAEYAQRLTLGGFRLVTAGEDRRSGRERRTVPRPGVADRRAVQ
jgi:CheY-like chemotaxis protein